MIARRRDGDLVGAEMLVSFDFGSTESSASSSGRCAPLLEQNSSAASSLSMM